MNDLFFVVVKDTVKAVTEINGVIIKIQIIPVFISSSLKII